LDRQRDRVLYWDEQSSFNHNGRAHHGDGRFYFKSNANTNLNAYCKSDCNSDANGDSDSYLYSNTYRYSHVHADANTGGKSNAYRYGDPDSYTNIHGDGDTYTPIRRGRFQSCGWPAGAQLDEAAGVGKQPGHRQQPGRGGCRE
jgi:hypothetical protein